MKYEKGKSGNPKGRPKGAKGRVKAELAERIRLIVEANVDKLQEDLYRLEPNERIKAVTSLLQYVLPKKQTMDGLTITIRRWMLRGKFLDWYVDVLVDDSFAKTQGYTSINDMVERTLGKETFDEYCNGIPKWIRAFSNGSFAFLDAERYGHAYMGDDDRVI